MTIAWAAPQLTVTYPGDRKRVFWTDHRKVKEERPDGRTIRTRAHWSDNGALYVITRTDSGKRTEIFEISNDGRRLFVIIGVDGRGPRPMQLRRVYDRVAPQREVSRGVHRMAGARARGPLFSFRTPYRQLTSFLTTFPPFITNTTRSRAPMSRSGSPSSAIRSAS